MSARILALLAALLLAGCGFQLRGPARVPFDTLYIAAATTSSVAADLSRQIGASGRTRIVDDPKDAQAVLTILSETREKHILSLSGGGKVREFELRYKVGYQLQDKDKKALMEPGEIFLKRDFSFNDTQVLAKESEEALLYRDMQKDAVQQLVRRMGAIRL